MQAGDGTQKHKGTEAGLDLSVIVCTRNRCHKLDRALRHIVDAAARTSASVEIVVVDNNSKDATREIVNLLSNSAAIPIRYVFEAAQGLSFARNRGIHEACGAVIAFTDDDCIVAPDWIVSILSEFGANPDVSLAGGRVDLHAPEDKPITIRLTNERVRYSDAAQIYGLVVGCNFAVRRKDALRIGGFDPALGGSKGVTADDVDFIYRVLKHNLGVLYAPELRVFHDHGRHTNEEVRALGLSYVRGRGAFFCKYILKGDRVIMKHAWWELRSHLRSRPVRNDRLTAREMLRALISGAQHFILTRAGVIRP
jgi:glycosyltransferase involved in cell wall biosynthesis